MTRCKTQSSDRDLITMSLIENTTLPTTANGTAVTDGLKRGGRWSSGGHRRAWGAVCSAGDIGASRNFRKFRTDFCKEIGVTRSTPTQTIPRLPPAAAGPARQETVTGPHLKTAARNMAFSPQSDFTAAPQIIRSDQIHRQAPDHHSRFADCYQSHRCPMLPGRWSDPSQ